MRFGLAAALLLAVTATTATAQDVVLFVEGGPMRNRDLTWGGHDVANTGFSAGGGVRLGSRTEIRALVDVPPASTIVSSADHYSGTPPALTERVVYMSRVRNWTGAVLLTRLYLVGGHVRLAASAGWSSSDRIDSVTTVTIDARTERTLESDRNDGSHRSWEGPMFAAGAIVPLSSHFALAPEVRAVVYPAAESGRAMLRAGVNARWTF
jgi:hypothetical protein